MADEYYKIRRITGEKYDIFDKTFIHIRNIRQGSFYMMEGVELWDAYPDLDKFNGNPTVVFVFKREDTKEAYDKWCKQKES